MVYWKINSYLTVRVLVNILYPFLSPVLSLQFPSEQLYSSVNYVQLATKLRDSSLNTSRASIKVICLVKLENVRKYVEKFLAEKFLVHPWLFQSTSRLFTRPVQCSMRSLSLIMRMKAEQKHWMMNVFNWDKIKSADSLIYAASCFTFITSSDFNIQRVNRNSEYD